MKNLRLNQMTVIHLSLVGFPIRRNGISTDPRESCDRSIAMNSRGFVTRVVVACGPERNANVLASCRLLEAIVVTFAAIRAAYTGWNLIVAAASAAPNNCADECSGDGTNCPRATES